MIRIALVEDEEESAQALCALLERYFTETKRTFTVKVFSSGEQFLNQYTPVFDIIFMDIELKGEDGLAVSKKLRHFDDKAILFFCTRLAQFAIQGYKVKAQDYFVKPIAYEDLKLALDNVCPRIEREQDTMTLNVAVKNGVRRVAFSEIRFIESRGHTIIYHLAEEVLRVRGNSLSSMEKKLRPYGFACCNASFLVNLNYCVSLLGENLAMADGTVLHVTRTKRKEFIQILSDFMARTGIEEERK